MELEGVGRIDESVATAAAIEGASPRRKFRLTVDRMGVPVVHA
jgi:ABC-type sugar transport system permease subunit